MNRFFKAILATLLLGSSYETASAQLYVANSDAGVISEYNASTGELINASLVAGLSDPHGLALEGEILFVTEYGNGRVGKYDAKTGAAINASLITGLASPQAVALWGNSLYVSSLDGSGTGMVGKYDAITGAVINASFISGLRSPQGIVVSDNKLFVACGDGLGTIGEYDATSGAALNSEFLPGIPNPDGLALSGQYIWVVGSVNAPSGAVSKFKINTGANALGLRRALVSGLNYPATLALSGDDLFIASYADGKIGKYNATTGAPVNASFISGLKVSGIAAVPTTASTADTVSDQFDLLTSVVALDNLLIWAHDNIIEVILLLLVGALSLWALIGFFLSRGGEQSAEEKAKEAHGVDEVTQEDLQTTNEARPMEDVTRNQTGKSSAKPVFLICVLLTLVLVAGYMGYQIALSIYIAKITKFEEQTRKEMEAEQARLTPPASTPPPPTRFTLPAVLVDPENFKTENNWLASNIGLRIAELAYLALHPAETTQPDIKVQAQVKAEDHQVHLEITGFSNDPVVVDLKPDFAWDPKGYAGLATNLIGNIPTDSGTSSEPLPDELTTLLQLTGPNLAHEDVTLSGLLQKHPAWSAAHEEASLLLVALALRDRAAAYTDYRPMLSRATAHLAMAQALRGSTSPTWAGEIADAGIRALSGREVDALAHLDALSARADCPESAKTWIAALRLRSKNDWRVVTPLADSPFLLKLIWFQTLNDNITNLGSLRRLEKISPVGGESDWGHASLTNVLVSQPSVEISNQFCETTTAQDLHELTEELQVEDATPDPTQPIGIVLSEPLKEKLYVGQPPILKVIGPDMFKDFTRRHLLMEIPCTYHWLDYLLGEKDEAEKFRSATNDGFAGMRGLEALGFFSQKINPADFLRELNKEHKTWEPWEFADGRMPGNPNLLNIHPDIDTLNAFYQDGLPFGTAFCPYYRIPTLYISATFHKKQTESEINYNPATYPYAKDLQLLAPSSYEIFALDKNSKDLFKISQPWWDYHLSSIYAAEEYKDALDDEDYTKLLQKEANLNPDAWFQFGVHLRKQGKDDAAADADRKGFDEAYDDVLAANSVGPLVDYYYDHNRKDEAEMVAKRAADVYSEQGLMTYCKLLEKLGRLSEAEQTAKNIADRYDDRWVLDALYAAHRDFFPDQNKVLLDKAFPHGLEKVTMDSFTDAPTSGCVFTTDSDLLQQASLQVGDVVVSVDGYRVGSEPQYDYVRDLSTDPHMDMIIWRNNHYLEVHATAPDRKFQVDIQTYPPTTQTESQPLPPPMPITR